MEAIAGAKLEKLLMDSWVKISDLLEFEGPLLSHYKDKNGTDYFIYWVDFNETTNRWLLWKVTEKQIYDYLKGLKSLRTILLEKTKDHVFFIDSKGGLGEQYNEFLLSIPNSIPEGYLPKENSYYTLGVPKKYKLFEDRVIPPGKDYYLQHLKENSIFFKLSYKEKTYGETITALDAAEFLTKFSNSFISFVEYDFINKYKGQFQSIESIDKKLREIRDNLKPRVVELEYNSFGVGISVDFISEQINNPDLGFMNWKKNIINTYKEEVIKQDFKQEKTRERISQKYEVGIRSKIFGPFLDIISKEGFELQYSDYERSKFHEVKKLNKKLKENIIPKHTPEQQKNQKNTELVTIVLEVEEGQDISSMSKKEIKKSLVFSEPVENPKRNFHIIENKNIRLDLKTPIVATLVVKEEDQHYYKLINEELNIEVKSKDKDKIGILFQEEFIKNYNYYKDKHEDKDLLDMVKAYTNPVKRETPKN